MKERLHPFSKKSPETYHSYAGMLKGALYGGGLGLAVSEGIIWGSSALMKTIHGIDINPDILMHWRIGQDTLITTCSAFAGGTLGMIRVR